MKTCFQIAGQRLEVGFVQKGEEWFLHFQEETLSGRLLEWKAPFFEIEMSGEVVKGACYRGKGFVDIHLPQGNYRLLEDKSKAAGTRGTVHPGDLTAPMPGKVLRVLVGVGEAVKKGTPLMILEAMKMEHKILSPLDGVVNHIFFHEGERVSQDAELLEVSVVP